jgi:hypothetical protein
MVKVHPWDVAVVAGPLTGPGTVTCTEPLTEPPLPSETVTRRRKDVSAVTWGAAQVGLDTEVLLKVPTGEAGS